MDIKARLNNLYFWIGVAGVAITAIGIDFSTLTNWKLLLDALMSVLSNPVAIVSSIMAVIGIFVDTSTSGALDKK